VFMPQRLFPKAKRTLVGKSPGAISCAQSTFQGLFCPRVGPPSFERKRPRLDRTLL
jgi:hypothetical protein